MNVKNIGRNIFMSLIIPAVVFVFFMILCNATGHPGFGAGSDLQTIMYTSIYSGLIALAMAINLTSGRFDFSVGATLVLAIILGGNIAKDLKLGAVGLLLVTMLLGAVIGLISGLVYVALSLPPMVVSLGLAMIYEAAGFMFNNAKGVKLIGKDSMLVFSKMPWAIVLIVAVLAVLVILWDFTKFGYEREALISGQKIATDLGVNEKKNAVICYVIAGVLLGIAGCVYISKYGTVTPETGLSSSAYFMSAFLPIFIGGAIGKYSSKPIAIFIGAVTQAFFTSGFSAMKLSSSMMTVMNGVIVMVFLIYTSNVYLIEEKRMFREKLEKVKAARKAGTAKAS